MLGDALAGVAFDIDLAEKRLRWGDLTKSRGNSARL
jgi:hypothetical protein